MSLRIVRLGSPRAPGEGTRIGVVRYPPRGVRKDELAARDFYDVWFPVLAPSAETLELGKNAAGGSADAWKVFVRRYRSEMKAPERQRVLDLLAVLSRTADFSLGCYCADEEQCHRSVLRALLEKRGAVFSS